MLVILGAGSFAREVHDLCLDLGLEPHAFIIDVAGPDKLLGKPVFHVDNLEGQGEFIPAIVSPKRKSLMVKVAAKGWRLKSLVHPSASVSETAELDGAVVINRGVVVGNKARLLCGAIINRNASIGHDCFVGVCATVGPGANLAGGVEIWHESIIGMGANIREGIRVGEGTVVGMGSVVTKDIPAGETWWGVPARRR